MLLPRARQVGFVNAHWQVRAEFLTRINGGTFGRCVDERHLPAPNGVVVVGADVLHAPPRWEQA